MLRRLALLLCLLLPALPLPAAPTESAQQPAAPQGEADPEGPIADNSFLIEEAYNQEYGVVQHIQTFSRLWIGSGWQYSFTQEWPVNWAPRHQLSYTLLGLHAGDFPGSGSGIGDIALNYRYQLVGGGDARVAFAPRLSLLVPSGDSQRGRGAGATGVQFKLPLSVVTTPKLVTHWNAGATIIPRAKNELGDRADSYTYDLGQSFVWLAHPRFNVLLETVFTASQAVVGPNDTQWETSVVLNPGIRWAYNFQNGLQIVPGIAFPVEVGRAGRGDWRIFLYLSFEHPFTKARPDKK